MLAFKRRLAEARKEEGFTLIELAVVILIIGILLVIALPSFLGVRKNAQNKAAQSNLRTVLAGVKSEYGNSDSYLLGYTTDALMVAALNANEPSITHVTAASTAWVATDNDPKNVRVSYNANFFSASAKSKTGNCYMIYDDVQLGTILKTIKKGVTGDVACATEATQLTASTGYDGFK